MPSLMASAQRPGCKKRDGHGVLWDEQNLEENEVIKASLVYTKVDEPKTPYHKPLDDKDHHMNGGGELPSLLLGSAQHDSGQSICSMTLDQSICSMTQVNQRATVGRRAEQVIITIIITKGGQDKSHTSHGQKTVTKKKPK